MTPETICGLKKATINELSVEKVTREQLAGVANQIVNKIESLETLNDDIYKQMGIDKNVLNENLKKYKQINKTYSDYNEKDLRNINGIVSDSNIVILYKNYNYILWSILATIVIIFTIRNIKK